jgi:hypothetical protein
MDCWNRGFESRLGYLHLFVLFVVRCIGSLFDELITFLEESYRVCSCVCLIVCDPETSAVRRFRTGLGCRATAINKKRYSFCLMVEASDHGCVLHTRRIYVFSINGG